MPSGLETFEPRGAFYAFPRIGSTGLDDETFVERLLVEEHVAVVPGSAFGPSGAGHVRMCYATVVRATGRGACPHRAVRRSGSVGVRGGGLVTAAAPRRRAVRSRHRHRGPLPAADRVQDVLRLLDGRTTGRRPNTHICPVCLGLPGGAADHQPPAVEHVLATGAGHRRAHRPATRWDRKNYFYPDLPKGYQISQYDLPLASGGRLTFDTPTGPSRSGSRAPTSRRTPPSCVHGTDADGRKVSLVDFNRSGAPLMEIVTEPDIRSAEPARRYAEELQLLLRTIGASDADMERGQMRVEANVSLRPRRHRGVRDAGRGQEHELVPLGRARDRVRDRATGGGTRRGRAAHPGDARLGRGARRDVRMRVKEESDDYRYFPEPDLPPLPRRRRLAGRDPGAASRSCRPHRRARYRDGLGLSAYDAARARRGSGRRGAVRGGARAPPGATRQARSRTG